MWPGGRGRAVGTWLSPRAAVVPLAACALCVLATAARAQTSTTPERSMTAVRLQPAERLVLDVRLTEEAWRRAVPAAGFRQQEPNTGEPPTETTPVRGVCGQRPNVIAITSV